MSELEPLFTYAEAAAELQITEADCADPSRWVYEKVRAHKLDFVRCGRTPKLPLRSVKALRELITCRYTSGSEKTGDLRIITSGGPTLSGATGAGNLDPSSRRALERVTTRKRKRSSDSSQTRSSEETSKTGTRRLSLVNS